eukprot:11076_1
MSFSKIFCPRIKFPQKPCCPEITVPHACLIHDSLYNIAYYIRGASEFILNILGQRELVCPFQFDCCIATGNKPQTHYYHRDSDFLIDADDVDYKFATNFVDCIGNIKAKLNMNGLSYQMVTTDNVGKNIFTTLHQELRESCGYCGTDQYFDSKRLIGFIDRRKSGSKSDIYLYLPPTNCLDIPSNACELWYLAASRTCLLPNICYTTEK